MKNSMLIIIRIMNDINNDTNHNDNNDDHGNDDSNDDGGFWRGPNCEKEEEDKKRHNDYNNNNGINNNNDDVDNIDNNYYLIEFSDIGKIFIMDKKNNDTFLDINLASKSNWISYLALRWDN